MNRQGEFNLEANSPNDGYARWLTGRQRTAAELAHRLNLPLEHEVEVWLVGGIRLRGKLSLQEELLIIDEESVRHLGLKVDRVPFHMREMESCVRLD